MKNKEKHSLKTKLIILLIVGILFIGLPKVNAFANTFLPDKTMELDKKETGEYCIYLQNTGNEDLIQIIKIFEGQEYIINLDEFKNEFNVAVGTVSDDLPVCMKVKLPRDSEKGEKYAISYGVTSPASEDKEGLVTFAPVQIRERFYLTERLEKRESNDSNVIYIIIILAVAIAILMVLIIAYYKFYRKTKK